MRLDKYLSDCGVASRKELKQMIKKGAVSVDEKVIRDAGYSVDPEKNLISVEGEHIPYEKLIYLMMNKPEGVISATFDNYHKTVVDILPEEFKRFDPAPVGRLDIDTVGLLLLTNDGALNHALLSPKRKVPKTYFAKVEGKVDEEDIKAFSEGVFIGDYTTLPAELTVLKSDYISEIELTIQEGKFHQVKRMFLSRDKKVIFLKRISFASLSLDESLLPGECRRLSPEEMEKLERFC